MHHLLEELEVDVFCVRKLITFLSWETCKFNVFISKLVIACAKFGKCENAKYIKMGSLQHIVTSNNGLNKCVTMPTLSPQILLQQKDLAQDQREKIHLQVQLQQAGAGQLSIH